MAWLTLVTAGLVEVAWALSLKPTHGFTRLVPSLLSLVLMSVAVVLLTLAVRTLPIGTAYAVFTGIGAAGTVTVGIVLGGDPATWTRLGPIGLIVTGVLLLHLLNHH